MRRERVVFGGTFDPPHLGHMAVISGLRQKLGVPVLVVPNGRPPHREAPRASAQARLRLLRLAVAELGDPLVSVSDVEVRRGGPSYTADTLEQLQAEAPAASLLIALGSDAAATLPEWERVDVVLRLARLVVFDRSGVEQRAAAVISDLRLAGYPLLDALAVEVMAPELEASEIRERLVAGSDCSEQLARAVWSEIRREGLYGDGPRAVETDSGIIAST
ncbi:MAG: nicotinate (nicotinamide) nucleotide adenylyltransferase [Candidatus Dormibacteria bacterium]